MYIRLKDFLLKNTWSLLTLYALAAIVAGVQQYYGGIKTFDGADFTQYNNYVIFKQSFFHLLEGGDLYTHYLNDHWDLFKYSPSFAFLFGAFAWMPDGIGLIFWNLTNALCLWKGVRMLPGMDNEKKNFILLFSLAELLTSLQNSQSNALIAGLVLMGFALIERENFFWGCLLIAITVCIKLFGVFAFAVCLLYPQRWRMVVYAVVCILGIALLPLLVASSYQLGFMYGRWWHLLESDYKPNHLSLVGVLQSWSGLKFNQNLILSIGLVLLMTPLVRLKCYSALNFRLSMLAMVLLWMIVFNHKAESPTFIIAVAGIGVWYFTSGLTRRWRTGLLLLALVFTSLSTTDLFPDYIQENFFSPWSVKAIPCIIIYVIAFYEVTFRPNQLSPC